jgi:hypothetical protein
VISDDSKQGLHLFLSLNQNNDPKNGTRSTPIYNDLTNSLNAKISHFFKQNIEICLNKNK